MAKWKGVPFTLRGQWLNFRENKVQFELLFQGPLAK